VNQEKVKTLILHKAKECNWDGKKIPVIFPFEIPRQRDKDDKFEGATVLPPTRGVSNIPVAVGDFKSLYPSIMISNNICYTTEWKKEHGDLPRNKAPTVNASFVKREIREGILPQILQTLLQARDNAKRMMKNTKDPQTQKLYDSTQLQLKIIANSVYGVLTASGGWFIRMEIGESVTSWGRSMINVARNIASSAPFNAEVIYGDSVLGDTPILLRLSSTGKVYISQIKDVTGVNNWKQWSMAGKECVETPDLEVWSDCGWTKLKRVIRHLYSGKIWRVMTDDGMVDCTSDHSLLLQNGTPITPTSLALGMKLLHHHPDSSISGLWEPEYMAFVLSRLQEGRKISCRGKLDVSNTILLARHLGFDVTLKPTELFGHYTVERSKFKPRGQVISIRERLFIEDGYDVYDLQTENHHFHVCPGSLIVHNTDSIMMKFPGTSTVSETFDRLHLVCKTVTANFPPPVELQAEKVYCPHLQLGKKKYVGLMHMQGQDEPKIDSKGVEKNRLDNCALVRKTMERVFYNLMIEGGVDGVKSLIRQVAKDLIQGRIDISDLTITKSISKDVYAGKMVHVEVAKRMQLRDPSYMVAPGERIPFIVIMKGDKNTKLFEKAEDPLWAINHGMQIDVSYYLEKQLAKPLGRILMWYMGDPSVLRSIKAYEGMQGSGSQKMLKKLIEKETLRVGQSLLGSMAVSDISRVKSIPPSTPGSITSFMIRSSPKKFTDEEKTQRKAKLEEYLTVCEKCRGYRDLKVKCLQRDCANLFRLAKAKLDVEELHLQ
jgi:hypothetical protein